jgi:PKD repeat protein
MKKTRAYLLVIIALAFFLSIPAFSPQIKAQTSPTVTLTPPQTTATQINQVITLSIQISSVQNLWQWDLGVSWDPTYLSLVSTPTEGPFLSQSGGTTFIPTAAGKGKIPDISDTLLSQNSSSGSGVLATLQFQVIAPCAGTQVKLTNIALEGPTDISTGVAPDITPTLTTASASVSLSVGGAPVANAGINQTVIPGTNVVFNGTNSVSTGTNPSYSWTFNDVTPQTLSGVVANYTFNNVGQYVVTLTVQDSGGSSNATIIVNVLTVSAPVAKISVTGLNGQEQAAVGQALAFSANGSYVPGNGTIQYYYWTFGDGSPAANITQSSGITHAYSSQGSFTVDLTVFATDGKSGNDTTTITVGQGGTNTSANPTSTPSSSSNQPTRSSQPNQNSNSGPDSSSQGSSLPSSILAILILITIAVLVGSTFWLRKRT